MPKYQFNLKTVLFAALIVAILCWSTNRAVYRTRHNIETTRSAYAAQLVAYMCIEHMKSNSNSWPTDWDDLADDLKTGFAQSGQKQAWTMDDLKRRVQVDWLADVNEIKSGNRSTPIIWITSERDRKFNMMPPDDIIKRYTQSLPAAPQ